MLDRDPNADQPPDPSLLRPRPRSHRPKNAPKKQPQRGLGVAQLEKLRLEEQSKQHEAVCLASLQHHNVHHHSHLHLQEPPPPPPHIQHQHQLPLQHQHHSPTSSLCLPRQIKLIEPSSFVEPRFPLPLVKLNVANTQSSFFPLASMASRLQPQPLPLLISQQQSANEDDTSMSPLSQVHDLCNSSAHMRPSSAESHLSPILARATPVTRGDNSWVNYLYDADHSKEKDSTITFLSSACCNETDTKMQGLEAAESINAAITNLQGGNGNLHISMGKLYMQSEGNTAPFTDLCLRGRTVGDIDFHIPARTHLESPLVSVASGGVQTRELSSFQTISLCPTWSPVDKVLNRKRTWECTQELVRQTEAFKGVDLNTSVDEMEPEVTRWEPSTPLPFTIRDDWNLSPGLSSEKLSSENNVKVLPVDNACSECGSIKVNKGSPDTCVHGAAFLSLRKRNLDHEKWGVETSGEFLTLGPSRSSTQNIRNAHMVNGNCSSCPVSRKSEGNTSSWQSQQIFVEQAKGSHFTLVPRRASDEDVMMLVEYQPTYLRTPSQRKVELSDFFSWNKLEGCPGQLQESSSNEPLDLELRLSI